MRSGHIRRGISNGIFSSLASQLLAASQETMANTSSRTPSADPHLRRQRSDTGAKSRSRTRSADPHLRGERSDTAQEAGAHSRSTTPRADPNLRRQRLDARKRDTPDADSYFQLAPRADAHSDRLQSRASEPLLSLMPMPVQYHMSKAATGSVSATLSAYHPGFTNSTRRSVCVKSHEMAIVHSLARAPSEDSYLRRLQSNTSGARMLLLLMPTQDHMSPKVVGASMPTFGSDHDPGIINSTNLGGCLADGSSRRLAALLGTADAKGRYRTSSADSHADRCLKSEQTRGRISLLATPRQYQMSDKKVVDSVTPFVARQYPGMIDPTYRRLCEEVSRHQSADTREASVGSRRTPSKQNSYLNRLQSSPSRRRTSLLAMPRQCHLRERMPTDSLAVFASVRRHGTWDSICTTSSASIGTTSRSNGCPLRSNSADSSRSTGGPVRAYSVDSYLNRLASDPTRRRLSLLAMHRQVTRQMTAPAFINGMHRVDVPVEAEVRAGSPSRDSSDERLGSAVPSVQPRQGKNGAARASASAFPDSHAFVSPRVAPVYQQSDPASPIWRW